MLNTVHPCMSFPRVTRNFDFIVLKDPLCVEGDPDAIKTEVRLWHVDNDTSFGTGDTSTSSTMAHPRAFLRFVKVGNSGK